MVLNDANLQTPDSFSSTDLEADSPSTELTTPRIKPELIKRPDPFTLYVAFFGPKNWQNKLTQRISENVQRSRIALQRPLTQDELDCHVQYASSTVYHSRAGIAAGVLLGGVRTMAYEYKNPINYIYAPHEKGMSRWQTFVAGLRKTAQVDRTAITAFAGRSFARFLIWTAGGAIIWGAVATTITGVKLMNDPRMRDVIIARTDRAELQRRRVQNVAENVRARRREQQQQENSEIPNEVPALQEGSYEQSGYEGLPSSRDTLSQSADVSASPSRTGAYGYNAAPAEQNKGAGFFDDDDASPTAPEYRGILSQENSAAQGSAWERIRRQSQSQESSRQQQTRGSWGVYAAPSANGDSQPERDRAQAEFDRLLEAERNRSTDSETGDRRSGWWK